MWTGGDFTAKWALSAARGNALSFHRSLGSAGRRPLARLSAANHMTLISAPPSLVAASPYPPPAPAPAAVTDLDFLGVGIGVCGSVFINVGNNLVAMSAGGSGDGPRLSAIGWLVFSLGTLSVFAAFAFAAAAVVASLESLQFVVNLLFNYLVKRVEITWRMSLGTILILVGTAIVVANGPRQEELVTPLATLVDNWANPIWVRGTPHATSLPSPRQAQQRLACCAADSALATNPPRGRLSRRSSYGLAPSSPSHCPPNTSTDATCEGWRRTHCRARTSALGPRLLLSPEHRLLRLSGSQPTVRIPISIWAGDGSSGGPSSSSHSPTRSPRRPWVRRSR